MKVEYYEKVFLLLSVIVLAVGLLAIGASVFIAGVELPAPSGRVDPRTVRQTPPFDNPGVREIAPGRYEVIMLAQTWFFTPRVIQIPRGASVTFKITSIDVVHGFMVQNTTLDAMIIPGQITTLTATFDKPGTYLFVCHEYCGIGHQTMSGQVVVQ